MLVVSCFHGLEVMLHIRRFRLGERKERERERGGGRREGGGKEILRILYLIFKWLETQMKVINKIINCYIR